MTECNQTQFPFEAHFSRQVVGEFAGVQLTTEGGALLLRQADRKIGLLRRLAGCFSDARDPVRIEHELGAMLAQRIYGLALGYEDLNDHEELRHDPLLAVLAGKQEMEEPLAGKSTLNRLERVPAGSPLTERYHKITFSAEAIDELLVEVFLESRPRAPQQIVLSQIRKIRQYTMSFVPPCRCDAMDGIVTMGENEYIWQARRRPAGDNASPTTERGGTY